MGRAVGSAAMALRAGVGRRESLRRGRSVEDVEEAAVGRCPFARGVCATAAETGSHRAPAVDSADLRVVVHHLIAFQD